jgi:hypothetical protein
MSRNCHIHKCCALGWAVGLSVLLAGCATQPSPKSQASYQPSDLEGTWSWSQGSYYGNFVLKKDGSSYTGTVNDVAEGTYGDKIVDVVVSGDHIKFTRDGKFGLQYWEGTLKEENGVLRIVDGRWTKQAPSGPLTAEKTSDAGTSGAEKQSASLGSV